MVHFYAPPKAGTIFATISTVGIESGWISMLEKMRGFVRSCVCFCLDMYQTGKLQIQVCCHTYDYFTSWAIIN
jgi:hypothetical protein